MIKKLFLIGIASAAFLWGTDLLASVLDDILNTPPKNENYVEPKGRLILFPMDARTIVVAGVYSDFFAERMLSIYGARLKLADHSFNQKKLLDWIYRFTYNFASQEVLAMYHPKLRDAFENPAHFQFNTNSAQPLSIEKNGYWINAVGLMRFPRAGIPGTQAVRAAELVHFAYLRLNRPLENGEKVKITTKNGELVEFIYDDVDTLSRAIKVNQVGYAPEAGKKYAYLGMWLGSLGELPVREREGKPFHLRDFKTKKIVYTGKIAFRSVEQYITRRDIRMKLNGETVMELDFSDFKQPGTYFVQIPGVGRSWEFVVGPDAIGRAFYVQMRGLFHQRSGIAKTKQYTQWNFDTPDHMESWVGGFSPHDRQFGDGKDSCYTDSSGKKVKLRHFTVVDATKTEEKLPDVHGGWWDAGDFDRRTFHFIIVNDLLSVYQLFPEKFSDGQLDIPESGNGIPDIVDEAAWGVDVWRRAQNKEGGVGCWLEATSHPLNPDPEKDVQRYYLALPTRNSTIEYAAYAAKLARAYRSCGQKALSEKFAESAARAWNFALNDKNRIVKKFKLKKQGEITYTEPAQLSKHLLFKAALNLYLLTGEEKYDKAMTEDVFKAALAYVKEYQDAYFLSELLEKDVSLFMFTSRYRTLIRQKADELLKSQDELAYRNVNKLMGNYYFTALGWGNALPLRLGAFLILAWKAMDDVKYLDAVYLLADWMLGANPMGRSMTTGLGKVYPVKILSLPNNVRNFIDPIPGISIYTFSGMIHHSAITMIYSMEYSPRKDFRYLGCSEVLLPRSIYPDSKFDYAKMRDILYPVIPIWRRYANLEGWAVDQNEFSVWETMGPAAAGYAALLQPGWKPPQEWHKQKPKTNINDLPGYIFLP